MAHPKRRQGKMNSQEELMTRLLSSNNGANCGAWHIYHTVVSAVYYRGKLAIEKKETAV